MSQNISIDLSADPAVMTQIEAMKNLVENADVSDVIRAAVRYFSESSAEYEREVYIREQLEFDATADRAVIAAESTGKAACTEQEWVQLAEVAILTPYNMIMNVGQMGMVKTVKETAALASGIKALSRDKYKDNSIIQVLIEDFQDKNLESKMSHDKLDYDDTLVKIEAAANIVDRIDGGPEAQGYKQFLIDLTQHVAEAAGEGFMGSGEKVSQAELEYIDTLKSILQ